MGYERVYLSHFLEIVHAPPLPPKHCFEMVETLQNEGTLIRGGKVLDDYFSQPSEYRHSNRFRTTLPSAK